MNKSQDNAQAKDLTNLVDAIDVSNLARGTDLTAVVGLVALSSIDEGIHIVDSSAKTIFYNEAMGRIEGLAPHQVLGRPLHEVFPGLNPENSTLLRVLQSREPIYDTVQTYVGPKGTRITTVNSTIPIIIDNKCVAAMEVAKTLSRVRRLSERARTVEAQPRPKRSPAQKDDFRRMYSLDDILGESEVLKKAKSTAQVVAKYDMPVMIHGETGSGKELFAQGIHNASDRRGKEFVAINCSALPESLIESTLFGNVKGAFTGALDHEGLFEQADGGTLFLDEINSASPSLQGKLLRVLEEKAIRRVGANNLTPIDVRIITSCNIDPIEAVESGSLRSDLFYRLSVYSLRVPPLRERKEDIPILARAFADQAAKSIGTRAPRFSSDVLKAFMDYTWPGNVRELKNAVQSTVGLNPGAEIITRDDLPDFVRQSLSPAISDVPMARTLEEAMKETEKQLILKALREHNGKISDAAKALGITRQSLHYRMAKNGITKF